MPAFDSNEFSWSQTSVVLAGRKLGGIQGVKYKWATEKEAVYGSGGKARFIQHGNETITGEIMLLQSEYNQLLVAARIALGDRFTKVGDLRGLQLVISYKDGIKVSTAIVYGVTFTESEIGMGQGDKYMKITLPFLALDVDENA